MGCFFTSPSYGVSTIEPVSAARTRALVAVFAAVVGMTLAMASPAGAAQAKISTVQGVRHLDRHLRQAGVPEAEGGCRGDRRPGREDDLSRDVELQPGRCHREARCDRQAARGSPCRRARRRRLVSPVVHPRQARPLPLARSDRASEAPTARRSTRSPWTSSPPSYSSSALRNTRLLTVSRGIRQAVGGTYPLGAIIPSPRGMQLSPTYWPAFPYAELAGIYDVILPMSYYTYRVEGGSPVRKYTMKSIAIIRAETGKPRHSDPHDRWRRLLDQPCRGARLHERDRRVSALRLQPLRLLHDERGCLDGAP